MTSRKPAQWLPSARMRSVVTSPVAMAGFASATTGCAAIPAPKSVVTSLAAFGRSRPQRPGGRTSIPARFRYLLAVSRRTPASSSIRRNDQPSWPSAMTCCRFSSLKTLPMPGRDYVPVPCVNVSAPYFRWPLLR